MTIPKTYMTAEELGTRLHFHPRYIREVLVNESLTEGIHYIRPFGRRRILFIWEAIERDMGKQLNKANDAIPLARGGICHG